MNSEEIRIYCDACFEQAGVGIGIYCDNPPVSIAEKIERPRSSNAAECLAAIKALQTAQVLGLKKFCLCSDSQLVVEWTNGNYEMKSATAQRYVPQIRGLLKERQARIRWTPGKTNPADKLSRQAIGVWSEHQDPLTRIIVTPMDQLRFKDFVTLKCGRDEFTKKRLPQLQEMVNKDALEEVIDTFDEDKDVATCLRWVLRGLPVDKAIRKVKTDLEVGENARRGHRYGWENCCCSTSHQAA